MESVEYRQLVRQVAEAAFRRLHPEVLMPGPIAGARGLAEQYASIAEAEKFPRLTFSDEILQRALAACTYRDPDDQRFTTLLERSSLGPEYEAAYPHMREVLEATFQVIRTRGK